MDEYSDADTTSIINAPAYKKNPAKYLKNIDSSSIPSGILIDRVKFRTDIGLYNGKSRVKTGEYYSWSQFFRAIKKAANDTNLLPNLTKLRASAISMIKSKNRLVPIGIINMKYNKIPKNAIENGIFEETDSVLEIKKDGAGKFVTRQLCAATTFDYVLYGDKVNFLISPVFIYNNDSLEKIIKIDIDFGNGYIKAPFDEPFTIDFGDKSRYIMAKIRITYRDFDSDKEKHRYAHFNFLYSGTDAVPYIDSNTGNSKLKSYVPTPGVSFCLPANSQGDTWIKETYASVAVINTLINSDYDVRTQLDAPSYYYALPTFTIWRRVAGNYETETHILFGTGNTSGKLRKSIIISDAFDPKNMRDYYNSHAAYDPDPKKFDPRGLYQILNGDKSGWSVDNGANLAAELQTSGYDIVFVNYSLGAGDIPINAARLEALLDHLNNNFRDNNTEEFVLVGPSMGGIISRYCLTSMEKASPPKEHHVKLWISFDSPQEGANIPISLQYIMFYLKRRAFQHESSDALEMLNDVFTNSLNVDAAKQMLLVHYATDIAEWGSTWDASHKSPVNPTTCTEFNDLYLALHAKGYPLYSKNVAISNGGKEKLYDDSHTQIIKYNPDDWNPTEVIGDRLINDDQEHFIYKGEVNDGDWDNDYSVNISANIGFDNAPGGYNTSIYDLNYKYNNEYSFGNDEANDHRRKSCFMPTVSAFGIKPTRENIYKNWEDIDISQTPFDIRYGTSNGANEEHVRVSTNTSNWMQNTLLLEQRQNIQKPYPRSTAYTETVSKPCLYTAVQSVTIGGGGNCKIEFKTGANIRVTSPKIVFKPGVKVENGALLYAKAGSVVNGLKSATTPAPKAKVNYLTPSEYNGLIFDYSTGKSPISIKQATNIANVVNVYPNPVNNYLKVKSTRPITGMLEISNIYGQIVLKQQIYNSMNSEVEVADLKNDMYILQITGSINYSTKIIKQ